MLLTLLVTLRLRKYHNLFYHYSTPVNLDSVELAIVFDALYSIGKGFAIGSAALVSLALFGAFVTR